MALTSIPFCPYDGRQAGLLYLPARWRYTTRSGVGAFAGLSGLVMGRLLLPLCDLGEGDDLHWSLPMKAFTVAFRNELWEGELPGLLPMVGESAEFLRVQPQFTRHLDMQITQAKPLLGFRPGVETGSGLLHNVSFGDQPPLGQGHSGPDAALHAV